jgi:Ca2+-binding EF-hand superfamily protein
MIGKTKGVTDPDADLRDAFKVFDIDGDGIITARELKLIMNSLGQSVSEADIDEMIKEADTDCKFIYYLFSFFQHLISLYLQF